MTIPLAAFGWSVHWSPLLLSFPTERQINSLNESQYRRHNDIAVTFRATILFAAQTDVARCQSISNQYVWASNSHVIKKKGACDDHRQILTYRTVPRHFPSGLLDTQTDTRTADLTMLQGTNVKFKNPHLYTSVLLKLLSSVPLSQ